MSDDITRLLHGWPHDGDGELQVRRLRGEDGALKLQVRLDLGVMQMETTGRPDGRRPYGFDTLLEYFSHRAEEYRSEHGWYEGFELTPEECADIQREAMQFYHRRTACLALQDYEPVIEDADHNLAILDLLKAFARDRDDWLASEQFRAFIQCHRVQAQALLHLARGEVKEAVLEVDRGLRMVREILAEQERLDELEDCPEYLHLLELRRKLEARYHVGHRRRLQILLDEALRREDPDQAASLRAQLRDLGEE
ncbi:MAG: DNA helicase UvrBC [Armatimonadota bacterium]